LKPRVEDVLQLVDDFRPAFGGERVLVTGGAGFLGSWLCEVLALAGAKVTCLDNFATGKSENLKRFKDSLRIVRADVESATIKDDYDSIFHMSSRASPEEYQKYPIETLTANSQGTIRMLELARKSASTLVYASTSEVYGDAGVVPTPESYPGSVSSTGVRSCYDEAKRFGEAACMAFFRQHGVHVRIPRIFNSYGPRIRADGLYARVVPRFILQAIRNEPITIQGSGKQTRSFCYVTDTVRGLLFLGSPRGRDGEPYNVGSPDEITIVELAKKIKKIAGSKSTIEHTNAREDDPKRRCPDLSRINELGWEPRTTLEAGLEATIAAFREVLSGC